MIDINGDDTWNNIVKLYELTSDVIGNNPATPLIDGESNLPIRSLADRTQRIASVLKDYGIDPKIISSSQISRGQNSIIGAPLRGDITTGCAVGFFSTEFWKYAGTYGDTRDIVIGIGCVESGSVVTGGVISITSGLPGGLVGGEILYAGVNGLPTTDIGVYKIGIYLYSTLVYIDIQKISGVGVRSTAIDGDIFVTDQLVFIDSTSGLITMAAPTAADMFDTINKVSVEIVIKKTNLTGGFIKITGVTGVPDGYIDMVAPYDQVKLVSNGTLIHAI